MTFCVVAVYTLCNKYGLYIDIVFVMVAIYRVWLCVELCFNILNFYVKF